MPGYRCRQLFTISSSNKRLEGTRARHGGTGGGALNHSGIGMMITTAQAAAGHQLGQGGRQGYRVIRSVISTPRETARFSPTRASTSNDPVPPPTGLYRGRTFHPRARSASGGTTQPLPLAGRGQRRLERRVDEIVVLIST
jgi:hypothetical protein